MKVTFQLMTYWLGSWTDRFDGTGLASFTPAGDVSLNVTQKSRSSTARYSDVSAGLSRLLTATYSESESCNERRRGSPSDACPSGTLRNCTTRKHMLHSYRNHNTSYLTENAPEKFVKSGGVIITLQRPPLASNIRSHKLIAGARHTAHNSWKAVYYRTDHRHTDVVCNAMVTFQLTTYDIGANHMNYLFYFCISEYNRPPASAIDSFHSSVKNKQSQKRRKFIHSNPSA